MPYKRVIATVALSVLLLAATKKPATTTTIAPDTVPHPIAMFLAKLSSSGRKQVTYKAAASGTHFFFEETSGVTVYVYDGVGYKKQAFLKGVKLDEAMKRYK